MPISFECDACGKSFTVRDEFAGKTGQCKQCGHKMAIPKERDEVGYGLEAPPEPEPVFDPAPAPPPLSRNSSSWAKQPARLKGVSSSKSNKGFFSFGNSEKGGAVAGLFVVAMIVLRVYFRWDRIQGRNNANNPQAVAAASNRNATDPRSPFFNRNGPISLPNFQGLGPGYELEPGVMFHDINLGARPNPYGVTPGHGGKLWIYLPTGQHEPKSLPCILITGAGSTLLTGMDLGDGDRAEHLPYVRAGFAVVAFELDGALMNKQNPSNQEQGEAMIEFLNARAGMVNAHIALEYVLTKIPAVDPARISVAGHSSAGTLAVLFAEHEPRLKACVAFAPALDVEKHFGPELVAKFNAIGMGDLAVKYSPKNNEDKLRIPLFLFHAQDDSNVSVEISQAFANDLKVKGKPVTLDIVATGNHYDSMINEGIPHAIAWLNEQGAGPGGK